MKDEERAARALARYRGRMLSENGSTNMTPDQYAEARWRDYLGQARVVIAALDRS